MACGCHGERREALRVPRTKRQKPRHRVRMELDRSALRFLLSSRAEVVEAMSSAAGLPKATGRPSANISVLWRFYTSSVYRSGDLPAIATREACQNSVDSIRAAVREGLLERGAGHFEVKWEADSRTLTFTDNGVGMDTQTILDRFLSLGSSGKTNAADSGQAAGGFGVAKAVILGVSESFRWELRTRDNRVVSYGADRDIEIFDHEPPHQGAELRIFDVPVKFAEPRWDRVAGVYRSIEERILDVLGACDLEDVELRFNGAPVPRLFDRRRGSRLADGAAWGAGTTARIRGHRRAAGDRHGGYWVRLNGLFQFREPSRRGELPADVVIDLTTTVRPGQDGYPLNAARDALQAEARDHFEDLITAVERENESAGRDDEDEVFDPDSSDQAERAAADTLAGLTAEAFDDPAFRRALAEAAVGLRDLYAAEDAVGRAVASPSSEAPPSTRIVQVALDAGGPGTPELIRRFLGDADARQAAAGAPSSATPILSETVVSHLAKAEESGALSDLGRQVIQFAVQQATAAAEGPGGGGLAQLASLPQVLATLDALAPPAASAPGDPRIKPAPSNPFGALAGLRISKRHYDRPKARRFRRQWAKWLPHLTVWDSTLRMIAAEANIRRRFKPGWVLNDTLMGLATASRGKTPLIYLHPDRFSEVLRAHRQRPLAVAAFLHGVGVHELTHLDGRMGQGHTEEFVASREALGRETAHLLPAIAVLVETVLGVKAPPSAEVASVARLERQVARLKAKAKDDRAAREALARAEVALERCRADVADAAERSAQVRAEQSAQGAGGGVAKGTHTAASSGLHVPEVNLRQALDAGNPHLVVYAIAGKLLKRPPTGLGRDYIEGFVRRNEDALLAAVAPLMGWGR